MNRFKEKLKSVDVGRKMTRWLHFMHNKNFPENIKTGPFIHFLKPLIRYSFRKFNKEI